MSTETRTAVDYCVAVEPTPRERAAFQDAVRLARELGVTFKPGEAKVRWWRREAHEPFGFIVRTDARPLPLWLGVGGNVEQIVSTSAHEIRHARDWLDGRDRFDDRVGLDGCNDAYHESEARAKAFAQKVLDRWHAERRPRPTTSPQPGVSPPASERTTNMRIVNSPAFDIQSSPQLFDRALRGIDRSELDRRRRASASRRHFGRDVLSDTALVKLTLAAAIMQELLADDLDTAEAKIFLDCKAACAARLKSADWQPNE